MKTGKFVFALFVFFSATIFSQSWNTETGVIIIPPIQAFLKNYPACNKNVHLQKWAWEKKTCKF